ncbi:MAG: histidine ammonia-lyase [Candidatus Izemoplasmataceae bacterium]
MIKLNGNELTLEAFIKVTKGYALVEIDEASKNKVTTSRETIEKIIDSKSVVYGINTGFGKLSDVRISCDDVDQLQENLLKSHACGIGNIFSEEIIRGMLLLRVNALIKGYSGIRLETVMKMVTFLNEGITPIVYEQGSLGASGDLVPLAHMALPLIGLGEVFYKGERLSAVEALKRADIKPLESLKAKEGLALINGTQAMTSAGAHALYDAFNLLHTANISAALTFEALEGIIDVFDEKIHLIRNQEGQIEIAKQMLHLLDGSKNVTHQGDKRVQDAYSLRCVPQVHGATLDTLLFIKDKVEREMNAATDNPVVFDDGKALSAGNFHGQVIALPMDYLAIAVSEIANISERRLERLVNPALNQDLPPFLVKDKGLNSGFMIIQYTAASLVSENKVLSHPASVDSIPSSGNQEDHVSMGTISARKALKVIEQSRQVVGMEILTALQALDFRGKERLSPILKDVYKTVRAFVPFIEKDTIMHPYIVSCETLIKENKFYKEGNPWIIHS